MIAKAMTLISELGISIHCMGSEISKWAIRHGAEVDIDDKAAES